MQYQDWIIYDLCETLRHKSKTTIELIPQDLNNIITHENNDGTLEIGIPKKVYLKIFQQYHDYWHSNKCGDILLNTYYCTLGSLITTNGNHHVIKLHETVCYDLLSTGNHPNILKNDFFIILSYVTSKLKKINKSSSLWLWLKKLSIIVIFNKLFDGSGNDEIEVLFKLLIDNTIKSCELHPSNYYAANYLRWCIRLVRNVDPTNSLNDYIKDQLIKSCHKQLSDVSLWSCLELYTKHNVKDIEYVILEYNTIVSQLPITEIRKIWLNNTPITHNEFLIDEMNWLITVRCHLFTPYWSIVTPNNINIVIKTLSSEEKAFSQFKQTDNNFVTYQDSKNFIEVLKKVIRKYHDLKKVAN